MPRYRGYMVEVIDAGTQRLRWRRMIGVGPRRPDAEARSMIAQIREQVWTAHGPARHVVVSRFDGSDFPAGAMDREDSRWFDRLPRSLRAELDSGARSL